MSTCRVYLLVYMVYILSDLMSRGTRWECSLCMWACHQETVQGSHNKMADGTKGDQMSSRPDSTAVLGGPIAQTYRDPNFFH